MSAARRSLWTILAIAGLIVAGVFGYFLRTVLGPAAKWSAADRVTATLQVHAAPPVILPVENRKPDPTEFEAYKRSLAGMFKSGLVINKALDARSIQGLPVIREHSANLTEWLTGQIEIEIPEHSELISVSLAVGDRSQGKQILDALLRAFKDEIIDGEQSDRLARKLMLEKKCRDYKQVLLERQRQLFDLAQQVGTPESSATKVRNRIETVVLDNLVRSQAEIEKRISELDLKIALAKHSAAGKEQSSPDADVEAAIAKDPQIQVASAELTDLEREQRATEKVVKNAADPALVRIRDSINTAHQRIEALKTADRQHVLDGLRRRNDTTGPDVASLELERKLLNEQVAQTKKQIEAQAETASKLGRFNGDAEQLRAEIGQRERLISEMSDALARMNIELDAPSRVHVYESAH